MGNDFQREHERDEPLGDPEELLDVLVMPHDDADHVVQHEDEQGHAHRRVQVGGRSVEARNEAHEVGSDDVDENAGKEVEEEVLEEEVLLVLQVLLLIHIGLN